MARKFSKGNGKPKKIEEPKELAEEKEAIIIDPELLKTEAPEVEEKLMTIEEITAQEEYINEVPEEIIVEKSDEGDVTVTIQEEIVEALDEAFGVDAKEEVKEAVSEVLQIPEEKIQVVVTPKRTIDSLSPAQLKAFQRTGFMPK